MAPITIVDRTKPDDVNATITQLFKVYIKGPGCPLPITMAVAEIWEDYSENWPSDEDREAMSEGRYMIAIRRSTFVVRRDLLSTVVEGLDVEDANCMVIPDDDGKSEGLALLIRAGWFDAIPEPVNEDSAANAGTETVSDESSPKGEDVTGELTSSTVAQPTQE
jgi:hypothetical protein